MNTRFTTFCVVIEKRIAGHDCPLLPGSCMWRHRKTGNCTYDEQFANSEFTVNEYAARVGLPNPDPEVIAIIKNSLAQRIKHELID